jgi:hypothetical protein
VLFKRYDRLWALVSAPYALLNGHGTLQMNMKGTCNFTILIDLIFSMLDASTKGLRNECRRVQNLDIFNGASVLIGIQELVGSIITIIFKISLRMQHDFSPCLGRRVG